MPEISEIHGGRVLAMADVPLDALEETEKRAAEDEPFSERVVREAKVMGQILEVEYGFLEADHEATAYLNGRLKHLFPDREFQVRVADNEAEPNALALPDGTIIVTKGLLRLAETQDELDSVLAHEATHIIRGHAAEIEGVIAEAKKRYQTKDQAGNLLRLLGAKRLAEYEADIRGVMQLSKQRVNPAAARSFFLKLDEYEEAKGFKESGLAHGKNIGRLVNIGAFATLFDSAATMLDQQPMPDNINEYAETATEGWLLGDIVNAMRNREIEVSARRSSLKEIILTLGRTRAAHAKIENDATRRRERENYEYFHDIAGQLIAAKTKSALPELEPAGHEWLTHALLTMGSGISLEASIDGPFEQMMHSLDEIADETTLWQRLELLSPETFARLGVVAPNFGDIGAYLENVLRAANEHEFFVSDEGEFDAQAYVTFVKKLTAHFHRLSLAVSFEPIRLADLTPAIVGEGLLNLDLKASPEPLVGFVNACLDSGIDLDVKSTLALVQEAKHVAKDASALQLVEKALLEKKPVEQQLRDISSIVEKYRSVDSGQPLDHESEKEKDSQLERALAEVRANVSIRSVEDIVVMLIVGYEAIEMRKTRSSGRNDWSTEAQMEHRKIQKSLKSDVADLLELWLVALAKDGADFLPADRFERWQTIFAKLRLEDRLFSYYRDNFFTNFVIEIDRDDSLDSKQAIDQIQQMIAVGIGEHTVYDRLGERPRPLRPVRVSFSEKMENNDNVLLREMAEKYYATVDWLPDESPIEKGELLEYFRWLGRQFFPYVDSLPSESNTESSRTESDRGSLAARILDSCSFDLDDKVDQELLLYVAFIVNNRNLRARLQEAVLARRVKSGAFAERLDMLFTNQLTKVSLTYKTRKKFVEEDMQTHDECRQVERAVESYADIMTKPEYTGAVVALEVVGSLIDRRSKRALLKFCLEASQSDAALKKTIWGNYIPEQRQKRSGDDSVLEAATDVMDTEDMAVALYTLNDAARFALVREFLIGEGGLLLTPRDRKWLVQYFLRQEMRPAETATGAAFTPVLEEVLLTVAESATPDFLFLVLAPVIHDRILRRPSVATPWSDIFKALYPNDRTHRSELNAGHAKILAAAEEAKKSPDQRTSRDPLLGLEVDGEAEQRFHLERLLAGEPESVAGAPEALSVEKLLFKIVENFGAPGVRFLQLIGQYVEVPEELMKELRNAYDRVERQSKPTSIYTMRREWPTFEQDVELIMERRGGGSLMTSYRAIMTDGTENIIKVLNANASLFVKETMQILRKAFDALAAKNPKRYGAARLALDDIETWILEDINYDRFLENDKIFREAHNGKKPSGENYAVFVPESRAITPDGKDNMYIKVERFVHGKTLVRPEELAEHDMKQIASVIVKDHIDQIMNPVKTAAGETEKTISLVHSDVHPGNFIAGKNDTGADCVAIIDRNNYLEFDAEDRAFILSLFSPAKDSERAVAFLEYLEPRQKPPIELNAPELIDECAGAVASVTSGQEAIQAMKPVILERGLYVPLKLTLLIKNLNALDVMSRQAGFGNGVAEAYEYTPD